MGEAKGQWNLIQLAFIAVYPAYLSYLHMVSGLALIALYLFLFILCAPPMFIQLKLGGYAQRGIVGLLSHYLPIAKGVGVALLIDLFLTCVYFAPLVTHFGMYGVISMIQEPYLWGQCGNTWNTENCVENFPVTNINKINRVTPEKEFFDKEYLQITESIGDVQGFPTMNNTAFHDSNISLLPAGLTIVWIFVFLIIAFGARVCGWLLCVLSPAFIATLFAVLIYGYSHLDMWASNDFLKTSYSLDFSGFEDMNDRSKLMKGLEKGFCLLMIAFPVWTAIPVTFGKMIGPSKVSRNLGWVLLILVYAFVVQVPQLAMAPYLGNLMNKTEKSLSSDIFLGFNTIFQAMPAAFSVLEIPPVYAFLFYLSLFISGVMFLSVAMFTIVDNITDSLTKRFHSLTDRRLCTNFVVSFIMVVITLLAGLIHMTHAGIYYTVLMDQSVLKLRFITVALLSFSIIIVYVKHNFFLCERIVMSIWCIVAAIAAAGFWLYSFILTKSHPISYAAFKVGDLWELISWLLAGIPYIAIPCAAMHSCMSHEGSLSERTSYLFCGNDDEDRDYDGYYPAAEPTAPPYSYMDNGDRQGHSHQGYGDGGLYPVDDLNKHYNDPEMEPLNTQLRTSRI